MTSLAGAYASARRARESGPLDPLGALALGLTSEVRGLSEEARKAYEDAAELAAVTGGRGVVHVVAREAGAGLARLRARGYDGGGGCGGSGGADGADSPVVAAAAILTAMNAAGDGAGGVGAGAQQERRERCAAALETGLVAAEADEGRAGASAVKAELLRLAAAAAAAGVPSPADLLTGILDLDAHALARVYITAVAAASASSSSPSSFSSGPSSLKTAGGVAAAAARARVAMRECCPPHMAAAWAFALEGSAASAAGDAPSAARHLAKAVHASPGDVALRGALARVLPGAAPSLSASAARLVPTLRAGVVAGSTPTLRSGDRIRDVVAAAAAGTAAALAAVPGDGGPEAAAAAAAIGRRLSHAYHLYPDGGGGAEARALLALALARRVAAGDGGGARCTAHAAAACLTLADGVPSAAATAAAPGSPDRSAPMYTALHVAATAVDISLSRVQPDVIAPGSWSALPGVGVAGISGSHASLAVTLAAAAAAAVCGDSAGAEAMLREVSRATAEATVAASGVQPAAATTARLLLGALLLARAIPPELGGGGEARAAKEAGKLLVRAVRSADGTSAAAAATLALEAELISAAAKGAGAFGDDAAATARKATAGWRDARVAVPGRAHAAVAAVAAGVGDGAKARRAAQKAVHAAPCSTEHWRQMWGRVGA